MHADFISIISSYSSIYMNICLYLHVYLSPSSHQCSWALYGDPSSSLSFRYNCVNTQLLEITHTHWTSESSDELTPSWWIWGSPDKMAAVGLFWFSWTSWSTSWGLTDWRSVHLLHTNLKLALLETTQLFLDQGWKACRWHFGNNTATCFSSACVYICG